MWHNYTWTSRNAFRFLSHQRTAQNLNFCWSFPLWRDRVKVFELCFEGSSVSNTDYRLEWYADNVFFVECVAHKNNLLYICITLFLIFNEIERNNWYYSSVGIHSANMLCRFLEQLYWALKNNYLLQYTSLWQELRYNRQLLKRFNVFNLYKCTHDQCKVDMCSVLIIYWWCSWYIGGK